MGEGLLGPGPARRWVARMDRSGRGDHLVHGVAQGAHLRRDQLRKRSAARAEHRRAGEQCLDGHEAERLVPLRRIPEASGAREERGPRRAVYLAPLLYRSPETGSPAARDDQRMAGVLRGFHRPMVALRAVQLSQEQVVLCAPLRGAAKHVVRRIEPVIDEGLASVPACVILREENGVGIGLRSGFQVAVDGLYEWKSLDAVL